jgi:hypothetical protein
MGMGLPYSDYSESIEFNYQRFRDFYMEFDEDKQSWVKKPGMWTEGEDSKPIVQYPSR